MLLALVQGFGPFEMSFYAEIEDDYMLRVDDFGMNLEGGGWLVMEPTQEQIESMHKEILSKVEEIERSKVVEYQEKLWGFMVNIINFKNHERIRPLTRTSRT